MLHYVIDHIREPSHAVRQKEQQAPCEWDYIQKEARRRKVTSPSQGHSDQML